MNNHIDQNRCRYRYGYRHGHRHRYSCQHGLCLHFASRHIHPSLLMIGTNSQQVNKAVCCSVLQCVAVRCSALQCSALQCVATCRSVSLRVAECCSVSQLVAMRCSMLFINTANARPHHCKCPTTVTPLPSIPPDTLPHPSPAVLKENTEECRWDVARVWDDARVWDGIWRDYD